MHTGAGVAAGVEGASVVYKARGSMKAPGARGLTTPWLGMATVLYATGAGIRLNNLESIEAIM